jgi:flagellar L-ring protein precursor FlgH
MTDSQRFQQFVGVVLVVSALTPRVASAQTNTSATAPKGSQANAAPSPAPTVRVVPPKTYDEIYEKYLASARGLAVAPGTWMADLTTDPNARRLNDLVTIRVVESISASGSADSNIGKASSGNIKLPLPSAWWDPTMGRITPFSAETKFNGSGETNRTTELSATMTARVIEVLPNGDLVVQGVRELDINGDRNLVVLSGVIRAMDVMPGNVVPSTRIGQLRISTLSQGLIKDSLTPGYLIRLLNKIF